MSDGMTYYDLNGHRLRLIDYRPDGKATYEDLDDNSRVVCHPNAVSLYPPASPVMEVVIVL